MGLFSKFKNYRDSRQTARTEKAAKTIKNPKAIKEDRWACIDYMAHLEDPTIAVPALLGRFDYSLEHGINDTREKELAMEGITRHGEKALPIVRDHLLATTRIAWPLKILKALSKESDLIATLKASLNFSDVSFDESATDKNYDILCYLIDYKVPGFATKLAHFLNDPDERVRFACTEVLIEQEDPEVPELLERFLSDASSENTRIRQAVLNAFWTKKWTIKNPGVFPGGQIIDELFVTPQGKLEVRNPHPVS